MTRRLCQNLGPTGGRWDMSGSRRGRASTAAVAALLGGLVALPLAGCSGAEGLDTQARRSTPAPSNSSPTSAAGTPSTPSGTSTSPGLDPSVAARQAAVAEVKRGFAAYQAAYLTAIRTRNARVPDLVRNSTPRMYAADRASIARMREENVELRGEPRLRLGKVSFSGDRAATLRVCEYDSAARFVDLDTGRLAEQVSDKWEPYVVRLVKGEDRWRLDQYIEGSFRCRQGR